MGWGWPQYYPKKKAKPVEDGIKARSRRGAIGETWWSKRWVEMLESLQMGARLGRGKRYARRGQVAAIAIQNKRVVATVQGTASQPYLVSIELLKITDEAWELVFDAVAERAVFAAQLLAGEMPTDIERAFNAAHVALFPRSKRELVTDCSCPDWANPCKHIAAVYYLLAERFDDDPFLIMELRGRTKSELLEAIAERRQQIAAAHEREKERASLDPGHMGTEVGKDGEERSECERATIEDEPSSFWEPSEPLEHFFLDTTPPIVDCALLKRLGPSEIAIRREELRDCLTLGYQAATQAARDLLEFDREDRG